MYEHQAMNWLKSSPSRPPAGILPNQERPWMTYPKTIHTYDCMVCCWKKASILSISFHTFKVLDHSFRSFFASPSSTVRSWSFKYWGNIMNEGVSEAKTRLDRPSLAIPVSCRWASSQVSKLIKYLYMKYIYSAAFGLWPPRNSNPRFCESFIILIFLFQPNLISFRHSDLEPRLSSLSSLASTIVIEPPVEFVFYAGVEERADPVWPHCVTILEPLFHRTSSPMEYGTMCPAISEIPAHH